MAAGIVGGMPASALAEDLEMNDSYTVDSDKTVDSITASITDKNAHDQLSAYIDNQSKWQGLLNRFSNSGNRDSES